MIDLSGRSVHICAISCASVSSIHRAVYCQDREMDKRKEGEPGKARAVLKSSVRVNGYVSHLFLLQKELVLVIIYIHT